MVLPYAPSNVLPYAPSSGPALRAEQCPALRAERWSSVRPQLLAPAALALMLLLVSHQPPEQVSASVLPFQWGQSSDSRVPALGPNLSIPVLR